MIRKFITAAVATAVIGTAAVTAPTQAEAHGIGLGIAAGIVGGTILGATIANSRPVYYEGDYVRCHDRRFVDDWGRVYWRRICHRY